MQRCNKMQNNKRNRSSIFEKKIKMHLNLNVRFLILFLMLNLFSSAQNVVIKKTYFDYKKTKLKSEWQQSGNGYINGYYKEYHSNGKLYIDRFVITDDVYPYWSTDLKYIEYDEAGNVMWSVRRNANKQFEGDQVSYKYSGTSLKLKSKASFNQGKLLSYNLNWNSGLPCIEYIVGKSFKRYSSEGELLDNVTISTDGKPSGKFYQGNNDDQIIEVQNGKIQTVKPLNNDLDNAGHLFRLSNDTLVSSFVSDNFRHKKFYIDTVNIKFLKNPFVDADFTQWQKGFIGLLFMDPRFLSCGLSNKYCLDMLFYNRDLLTYIKEEKRDLKTDQLLSLYTSEKDIHYYPSGKIKEIAFSDTNWEQYDENGTVINSYEKELKSTYSKNYNFMVQHKLNFLRNTYGWNKFFINPINYKKHTEKYITENNTKIYKGINDNSGHIFTIIDCSAILIEDAYAKLSEASATINLLKQRSKIFSVLLVDGLDKLPVIIENIESDDGPQYQLKVNEGYKNIFQAYRLMVNKLNDSISNLFSTEPQNLLSQRFVSVEMLDLTKHKEIISLLTNEKFPQYGDLESDDSYIPDEWKDYNRHFLNFVLAQTKITDQFLTAITKNKSKLEKKLLDATSESQIIEVLKKFSGS